MPDPMVSSSMVLGASGHNRARLREASVEHSWSAGSSARVPGCRSELTAIDRSVGGSVVLDVSAAYVEAQERLCAVLVNLDEEDAGTPVPACPGWSIRAVVAHHCGAVVDTLTGNLSELAGANLLDQWRDQEVADARDALTGREFAERAGRSLQCLLDEWKDAS